MPKDTLAKIIFEIHDEHWIFTKPCYGYPTGYNGTIAFLKTLIIDNLYSLDRLMFDKKYLEQVNFTARTKILDAEEDGGFVYFVSEDIKKNGYKEISIDVCKDGEFLFDEKIVQESFSAELHDLIGRAEAAGFVLKILSRNYGYAPTDANKDALVFIKKEI